MTDNNTKSPPTSPPKWASTPSSVNYNYSKILKTIKEFISEMNNCLSSKDRPIALYNRLLASTTDADTAIIDKHINAFKYFFTNNPEYIETGNLSEKESIVRYSERIWFNVSTVNRKTKQEKVVREYLTALFSLVYPGTEESKNALRELKHQRELESEQLAMSEEISKEAADHLNIPDTAEGKFMKNTLDSLSSEFADINMEDANPVEMLPKLMQSGFMQKFMGDFQKGMDEGNMDIGSLMKTVMGVVGGVAPSGGPERQELQNMINSSIGSVEKMTGQGVDDDLNPINIIFSELKDRKCRK